METDETLDLEAIRQKAAAAPTRPRTLVLQGVAPLAPAGEEVAELVALAGGALARSLDEADVLILSLPGQGLDAAEAAAQALADLPGWYDLACVENAECFCVDGSRYLAGQDTSRVASAQILATILHPERFTDLVPPYSVRLFPTALLSRPKETSP